MLQREVQGEGFINRPAKSSEKKRRWKRLCLKTTWFQPSGKKNLQVNKRKRPTKEPHEGKEVKRMKVEGVLYVPFTPNSQLKKEIQKSQERGGGKNFLPHPI